ncbi:MAG: hypothetical protein IJM79_01140 [Erysipelotrichaceae bacterium]|nr:hypothetical protein [Erysipelotrichaceae bacterium]
MNNQPEYERLPEQASETDPRPFADPVDVTQISRLVLQDFSGTYRWIYELPMLKSYFLLFEVWKVLGIAALIIAIFGSVVSLIDGDGLEGVKNSIEMIIVPLWILMVLSLPAYYIVTKANNGKYTVLFEMDEEGIDHIQIKTDKAKALELLTIFVGTAAKNRTTTAAGLLSASGGNLYSPFSKVRRIKAYPEKNLITLQGPFFRNQVYVDDQEFQFVYDYIVHHCEKAKHT